MLNVVSVRLKFLQFGWITGALENTMELTEGKQRQIKLDLVWGQDPCERHHKKLLCSWHILTGYNT